MIPATMVILGLAIHACALSASLIEAALLAYDEADAPRTR
jgi:hypothetical protein